MSRTPMIALLLLAACKPGIDAGGVKSGSGADDGSGAPAAPCTGVDVDTTGVAFVDVPLAFESGQELLLVNPCEVDELEVVLALSAGSGAGFALSGPELRTLAPGASETVQLSFTTADHAPQEGSLEVRDLTTEGTPSAVVPLFGQAAADQDGDGADAPEAGGDDCDDADPSVHPRDAEERRDLIDDDCDGLVDEDFVVAGDILVTEIMANPVAAADATGEWIELTNTADNAIDLFGWSLGADDGEAVVLDAHLVVEPGARLVLGASDALGDNGGVSVDHVYDRAAFTLSDAEDTIALYMGETVIADVGWSAGWPMVEGRALSLDREFVELGYARQRGYWCAAYGIYGDGDRGSPGDANNLCANVDHDFDGYSQTTGDCDDTDASISPGAAEVWDGIDNDCDGLVDALTTDHATGYAEGDAPNQALSWSTSLSTGDIDGDGLVDVLVGTQAYGSGAFGTVWAIAGADLAGAADSADDLAFASFEGSSYYEFTVQMGQVQGDVDGDGTDDLFIVGSDYYASTTGGAYAALLHYGGSFSGTYDAGDADVRFTGSQGSWQVVRAHSSSDLDGDGLADVAFSDPQNYTASTTTYVYSNGRVAAFLGGGLASGDEPAFEDADIFVTGAENQDLLGSALGGGDLDGDGYAELIIGAPGDDAAAYNAGALWIIAGGTGLSGSGEVSTVASNVITATGSSDALGQRVAPQVGDVDGDGAPDLAIAMPGQDEVFVFLDTTTLGPTSDTRFADVTIDGDGPDEAGAGLLLSDLDGDGADEVIVGAPDTAQGSYAYYVDEPGEVSVFDGSLLGGGAALQTSGGDLMLSSTENDGFGITLASGDTDGDGRVELLVGASVADGAKGRLFLFDLD
jgi:hypothetical protein